MSTRNGDLLGAETYQRLASLLAADTSDFNALVNVARLDPKCDFRHADLAGTTMAGADLRGFDFSYSDFRDVDVTGALIAGARFEGADLAGTDLGAANGSDEAILDFAVIQDAAFAPELVVIPSGSFRMGSTEPERRWALEQYATPMEQGQRYRQHLINSEGHQHQVAIESFCIGRCEVTLDQFATFVETTHHDMSGACRIHTPGGKWKNSGSNNWLSPGFQQNKRHPVVCVSWKDAKAYVMWLTEETGKSYRLPSEAEWEYSCRAGTATRYWWGDEFTPENVNYGNAGKTIEVDGCRPNPWGLYDMPGNVWEWTEDCWNHNYKGAPDDGSAWTNGDCSRRVLRGGAWGYDHLYVRSASRAHSPVESRSSYLGFRVVKTLASSESVAS